MEARQTDVVNRVHREAHERRLELEKPDALPAARAATRAMDEIRDRSKVTRGEPTVARAVARGLVGQEVVHGGER